MGSADAPVKRQNEYDCPLNDWLQLFRMSKALWLQLFGMPKVPWLQFFRNSGIIRSKGDKLCCDVNSITNFLNGRKRREKDRFW
jgi:hypothetical protein